MEYEAWKAALINEIETIASSQAERVIADTSDPRFEKSQIALRDLARNVKALPPDSSALQALYREEQEIGNLMRAPAGEPERRYLDAKEEFLQAYGFEHEPFATADQFLDLLRAKADETISEYRLRV
jgi:hypothetical protein